MVTGSSRSTKAFKGTFSIHGQVFQMYTHAPCEQVAFLNFLHQLDKKTHLGKTFLWNLFNGQRDNFLIQPFNRSNKLETKGGMQ